MKTKRVLMTLALCLVLGACSKGKKTAGKSYKIGVNQLMEHKALDDVREGFQEELKNLGVSFELDYKNAQGDVSSNSNIIASKFAQDKVDLILAISTPSAQSTLQATEEIPVLFSAVTDAVGSKLVKSNEKPGGNATGTIDAADVKEQLEMFKKLDPKIKTIGIIYNTSESNSEAQIKEVEKYSKELGLEVKVAGINNVNDLPQSLQSLVKKVDAMYLLSDNMIANSISVVTQILNENKMISISAEESQVKGGALMTKGLSYKELGKQTAKMAKKILVDGVKPADLPVEKAEKTFLVVNKSTLKALGISEQNEIFKDATIIN